LCVEGAVGNPQTGYTGGYANKSKIGIHGVNFWCFLSIQTTKLQKKTHIRKKIFTFLQKNLRISKKSSTFAPAFEIEGNFAEKKTPFGAFEK
jgi:hypothetical protein